MHAICLFLGVKSSVGQLAISQHNTCIINRCSMRPSHVQQLYLSDICIGLTYFCAFGRDITVPDHNSLNI